eukprot:scaffold60797_cov18-Tisochrysis_lutea.AAC.1
MGMSAWAEYSIATAHLPIKAWHKTISAYVSKPGRERPWQGRHGALLLSTNSFKQHSDCDCSRWRCPNAAPSHTLRS